MGGTIDGYIDALDDILDICNEQTIIIPGHGAPSNRLGLEDYRNMLAESRIIISRLSLIFQGHWFFQYNKGLLNKIDFSINKV